MFPKPQRLSRRGVVFVVKKGKTIAGPSLRIKWVYGKGRLSRATVVTPLSFEKHAVRRNRVKRQLREILRTLLPQLNPPLNLSVFVSPRARGKNFGEFQHELNDILRRGRFIK